MAEDKENKNSNVRLPEELLKDLRKVSAGYLARGEKAPVFGDLLLRAWEVYKASISTDTRPIDSEELLKGATDKPPVQAVTSETGDAAFHVSKEDFPWVSTLLKILHSKRPGLPVAIKNNMREFSWADDAYCELSERKSPLVSAAEGDREPGGAARELPAPTEARRSGGESPGRRTGYDAQLDAIEAAEEKRKKGKGRDVGRTG